MLAAIEAATKRRPSTAAGGRQDSKLGSIAQRRTGDRPSSANAAGLGAQGSIRQGPRTSQIMGMPQRAASRRGSMRQGGAQDDGGGKYPKRRLREDHERSDRIEREYDAELFMLAETSRRDQQELEELFAAMGEKGENIMQLRQELEQTKNAYAEFQRKSQAFENDMQRQITRVTIERHELSQKCAEFDKIREQLQADNDALKGQVRQLEMDIKDGIITRQGIEHDASVMETNLKRALNQARRDIIQLRMTHAKQEREVAARMEEVGADLARLTDSVQGAVAVPLATRAAAADHLNEHIDLLRIRYQDVLQQCRLKAARFSSELVKVSSLHSNIPDYIKASLEQQTGEQLRRLVDTLAFDESVRQYLEVLFPAPFELGPDGIPRRNFKCPDTPSAALANCDLFGAGAKAREKRRGSQDTGITTPKTPPAAAPTPFAGPAAASLRAQGSARGGRSPRSSPRPAPPPAASAGALSPIAAPAPPSEPTTPPFNFAGLDACFEGVERQPICTPQTEQHV
eukprot:TRINITY_DN410_c0_g3_i1.p1 TRINITY_DN410_c0_g3~~TRINITY_DN410_c0_g3_i1.p1  ORF type:complete len:551 (+),score=166.30 TRINITY_DN410_c0_g3_i1:109-1653(+)